MHGPRAPAALLALSFVLLGAAWLMGNPPGGAPDESAHYVKALGAGRGDLYGEPLRVSRAEAEALRALARRNRARGPGGAGRDPTATGVTARTFGWQRRTTREFEVPAALQGFPFGCNAGRGELSARCLDERPRAPALPAARTYAGTYQPYVYVPPGLAMRASDDPVTALRLGRVVSAALSVGLLVLAAVALALPPRTVPARGEARPGATALLGLLVAVSPMVLFTATALSPSGPEIAASICFFAGFLRLGRDGSDAPRWAWGAVTAGGAVLATARALGPFFVVAAPASAVLLVGPARMWEVARGAGRAFAAAGLAIAVAVGANLYWEAEFQPHLSVSPADVADGLEPSLRHLPSVLEQAVGVFGGLDAPMPRVTYALWALMLGALLVAAAVAGTRRQRAGLGALVVGVLVAVVGLSAAYREIGPIQGRYVLPLLVLVPLWAGEVVHARRAELPPRWVVPLVGGVAAAGAGVHALGWYAYGRRSAVGFDGPWLYLSEAEWSPPGGWVPWLVLLAAGTACYALAGLAATRRTAPGS